MLARRIILTLTLVATLTAAASRSAASDNPRVVLESERMRVEIDPASNGRIASILDKKNGMEHLEPTDIHEVSLSPLLPTTITSNHGGLEDWFWKQYVAPQNNFRLTGTGDSPHGPWASVLGVVNGITVERRMTLLKSFPALQVDVTLHADSPVEASYWMHMIVAGDKYLNKETGYGMVAGAFSGDPAPRQGRGMLALEQSGPQKLSIGFEDAALAPAGNWFARLTSDSSAALALVVEKGFGEHGGFFYTWQDIKTRIGSLEAVWPPMKIGTLNAPPGQPQEIHLRYFLVLSDETDPTRLDKMLSEFAAHKSSPTSPTNTEIRPALGTRSVLYCGSPLPLSK